MNPRTHRRSRWLAALLASAFTLPSIAGATIVEFQTVIGDFEVNLYDNSTPATVTNFINYVNNGSYNNSIFHRSEPGFVVQGGGFAFDGMTSQVNAIPASAPVVNEPVFANVRGTIAMAKLGGDPNSATNQWFINLSDNTANLDNQNGGFTAFGEVVGNGMVILDAIAALPRFNLGGALTEIPLQGDPTNSPLDATNYIIVTGITISDSAVDSAGAAGLNPVLTTATGGGTPPPPPPPPTGGGGCGGGGGGFGVFLLLGLLIAYRYRMRPSRRRTT